MAANRANVVLIDDGRTRSNDRLVDGLCQTDCLAQAGDTANSSYQLYGALPIKGTRLTPQGHQMRSKNSAQAKNPVPPVLSPPLALLPDHELFH